MHKTRLLVMMLLAVGASAPQVKAQFGQIPDLVGESLQEQAETGEQRHEMIDTMAAALARNGQFGEAVLWQRRSLSLLKEDTEVTDEDRKKLAAEFEDRLKRYTSKQPYADKAVTPETEAEPLHNDDVLDSPDPASPESPQKPAKKKDNSVT